MTEAGVSAAQLAQRSGLTEAAISLLRSGRREPSYRTVRLLSAALPALGGIDPEQLAHEAIEAAIVDIREGKMVVVMDDEDRENEGDLVCAAEFVTPDGFEELERRTYDDTEFVFLRAP